METKYRVLDEYIDQWYGSMSLKEIESAQKEGLNMEEIRRLSEEWGVSLEKLIEEVEQI